MENKSKRSARFRHGTYATVITAIFLVAVVLINFISTLLVERFPLKADLTASGVYALTDQTLEILGNLEEEIKIMVLVPEAEFAAGNETRSQALEQIKLYAKHSDKIGLEFIDTVQNPAFKDNYKDLEPDVYDVLIQSSKRTIKIQFAELFNLEQRDTAVVIASSKAEQTVTSGIISATTDVQPNVGFITGHEEVATADFKTLLKSNAFLVQDVNLTTGGVPQDTQVLVIASPARDYTDQELSLLDAFLNNNDEHGNTIVFLPGDSVPANLARFLEEWGIVYGEGVVGDLSTDNTLEQNPYMALNNYAEEDISGSLKTSNIRTVMLNGKPIELLFATQGNRLTKTLVAYSETSILVPPNIGDNWDANSVERKAYPSIVKAENIYSYGDGIRKETVVAVATINAVQDGLINNSVFGNGEYFVKLFNNVCSRESDVVISTRIMDESYMEISSSQSNFLMVLFIFVVPLIIIIYGIVVFVKRRHQ